MADAVVTQVLHESKSDITVLCVNQSDGTGESAVTKVDPALLSPACTSLRLRKIVYATNGMAVKIFWDATTDALAWVCPQEHSDEIDFTKLGMAQFLVDPLGSGATGKIQFTTVGHTSGDSYAIILVLDKVA